MGDHRTEIRHGRRIDFSQIEKFHPHKTFLFFALLGSTVVFMTITFLYLLNFSRSEPAGQIKLPHAFFLSTILMLFSSYSMMRVKRAFQEDSFRDYFLSLGSTLALGMLFTGCQVFGWYGLYQAGFPLSVENHFSFFYVISGIHFLHVFTGIVFITVLLVYGYYQSRDPVKSLLFFSNRFHLTRIELGIIFWHFVDFLWLGLFLIFLFTF